MIKYPYIYKGVFMIIFAIACTIFGWWLRSKFQKMFVDPQIRTIR